MLKGQGLRDPGPPSLQCPPERGPLSRAPGVQDKRCTCRTTFTSKKLGGRGLQWLAREAGRVLKWFSNHTDPFMCEAGETFSKPSPFIPFLQIQNSRLKGPDLPKIWEVPIHQDGVSWWRVRAGLDRCNHLAPSQGRMRPVNSPDV